MGAADFLIFLRRQLRDDEVAFFIEEKGALAVLHNERVAPPLGFARGRFERFPEAITRVGLQTPELPVAARTVNVSVFYQGSAHHAVKAVGIFLADLLTLPDDRRFVGANAQHQRAVVKRGEEKRIAEFARAGDGHSGTNRRVRMSPIDFSRLWIQGIDRFGMPDDELPFAVEFVDHRRTITRFLRAERAPEFPAGILVERDCHTAFAAYEADQFAAVQQRVAGETPQGRLDPIVLFEVVRPDQVALFRTETEQISLRAERINFSVAHRRRGARSGRVTHRVGAVIFVFPNNSPVGFVQAKDAFAAGNRDLSEGI